MVVHNGETASFAQMVGKESSTRLAVSSESVSDATDDRIICERPWSSGSKGKRRVWPVVIRGYPPRCPNSQTRPSKMTIRAGLLNPKDG